MRFYNENGIKRIKIGENRGKLGKMNINLIEKCNLGSKTPNFCYFHVKNHYFHSFSAKIMNFQLNSCQNLKISHLAHPRRVIYSLIIMDFQ